MTESGPDSRYRTVPARGRLGYGQPRVLNGLRRENGTPRGTRTLPFALEARRARSINTSGAKLVENAEIESATAGCRPTVIPFH